MTTQHEMAEGKALQSGPESRVFWLFILFFISGFPALLYQIVWQRALLTIYGVNIQSVTMIVSVFMLGLGLGSMAGGWVSERPGVSLPAVFGLAELGVGVFGFFSLRLFHYVAQFTAGGSTLRTGAVAMCLLLIPTTLMGSTLPVLTEYLVRISGNVGRSVGTLYFVNTLGSAAACFAAIFFLMRLLGESGTVMLAAAINAMVGLTILGLNFVFGSRDTRTRAQEESEVGEGVTETDRLALPLPVALLVSGMTGMVSLAYEILWYRAFSVSLGGRAPAFAGLLGFFLTGIALGSLVSRSLCRRLSGSNPGRHMRIIAIFVIVANLAGFAVLPAMAFLARYHVVLVLPVISLAAALLGAAFPLIAHAAVKPDAKAGRGLSWIYFSNIVGSTLGSLLVGYVLMDFLVIRQIAVIVAWFGLAVGAALLAASEPKAGGRIVAVGMCMSLAALITGASVPLFHQFQERIQAKREFAADYYYRDLVENRSGVIAVLQDLTVLGGGRYDGVISTDLRKDRNGIFRAFSLSFWHPAPREVLMIGLAGGAWAQVVANNPEVERLTVVEINPGYLQVIRKYPQVASLLTNPKVHIEIDDGRRWLVSHPEAKFDAIVTNTTWNFRDHASMLLSSEYLSLIRRHLNQGGVMYYNTTSSGEVQLTGATVFPYAVMIGNHIAVSDSPIQLDVERWKRVMAGYRIDGALVLDPANPADLKIRDQLIADDFTGDEQAEAIRARNKGKRIVTDDNMGTEWTSVASTMTMASSF